MSIDWERIPMSQRELHRYHTLRLVLEHRITAAQAAGSLGLSERHIWWRLARLRTEGRHALVHGNRGRPSGRCLAEPTPVQILTRAQGPYAGRNTTHLTEKRQAEGLRVRRATVHRLLRAAGVARWRGAAGPRATGPGGRGGPRRAGSCCGRGALMLGWRTGARTARWSGRWTRPRGGSCPGPPSCPRRTR